MNLLVAVEERCQRRSDGHVYAEGPARYSSWANYLEVFDQVTVLARAACRGTHPCKLKALVLPARTWSQCQNDVDSLLALCYLTPTRCGSNSGCRNPLRVGGGFRLVRH